MFLCIRIQIKIVLKITAGNCINVGGLKSTIVTLIKSAKRNALKFIVATILINDPMMAGVT